MATSPRWWQQYFIKAVECLRELINQLQACGLLDSTNELTIWQGHYLPELGGEQKFHGPLETSMEEILAVIEEIVINQLNSRHAPPHVTKTLPIYLHLEGRLSLMLPDEKLHEVPFDAVISHRSKRKFHGDVYVRTFTYQGHEFIDFFMGTQRHVCVNREKLLKAIKGLIKTLKFVNRIVVGVDADVYEDLTRATLIYNRHDDRFIEDLLDTAVTLHRNAKEGISLPAPLTERDVRVIRYDLKPVNKTYIVRRIISHPFYQEDVPQYYAEHRVIRQKGSILMYHEWFNPMTTVHAMVLKDMATALDKALKPKDQFDKDLIKSLDEIHQQRKLKKL